VLPNWTMGGIITFPDALGTPYIDFRSSSQLA